MTEIKYSKQSLILYGLPGVGKTVSALSVLKLPGLKVRFLSLDPNAIQGVQHALKIHKIVVEPGQLVVASPPVSTLDNVNDLKNMVAARAEYINSTTKEALAVKSKDRSPAFLAILKGFNAFKGTDIATGEEVNLDSVMRWDSDCVLIVDGLTAINEALMEEARGTQRVATTEADYGHAQSGLVRYFVLTSKMPHSTILLAHAKASNTVDDKGNITRTSYRVALPGVALDTQVSAYYSDTIFCYTVTTALGQKHYWSGSAYVEPGVMANVVARSIPTKSGLIPDFSLPEYNFFKTSASSISNLIQTKV